jgi:hypothetical protein
MTHLYTQNITAQAQIDVFSNGYVKSVNNSLVNKENFLENKLNDSVCQDVRRRVFIIARMKKGSLYAAFPTIPDQGEL